MVIVDYSPTFWAHPKHSLFTNSRMLSRKKTNTKAGKSIYSPWQYLGSIPALPPFFVAFVTPRVAYKLQFGDAFETTQFRITSIKIREQNIFSIFHAGIPGFLEKVK